MSKSGVGEKQSANARQVRPMGGHGKKGMRGGPPLPPGKNPFHVLKRMTGYVLQSYKWHCLLVIFMILFSSGTESPFSHF